MITEDYVSYEVAKLLKEKGFDEICDHYIDCHWEEDGVLLHIPCKSSDLLFGYMCPTHQMAMKWLREKHNIHISVSPIVDYVEDADRRKYMENVYWAFDFMNSESGEFIEIPNNDYRFGTYDEAVEAALKYCLTELILIIKDLR